jgi:predicted lysophospholipase L1 biosynthesis ABC-type transport system permease subunit
VAIGSAGGSLSLRVQQTPLASTWPLAVSTAVPRALPAVVASARAALYPRGQIHGVVVVGLDDLPATADGVIRSVTLPQVGLSGTMVDFGAALAVMAGPPSTATRYQVWLSPAAPPDMAARLARQHVVVQRTLHSSRYRAALDHSGPAFADSLFLASALAAIVLAIGATAVARAVSVRRRGYELAALEAVGVPARTLRRATAAEQGSVFAIGLLVGLAAGVVGSWLALPSTPVFADASAGPPLVFGLPWALLAALAAGLVVVFVVVSLATARLVERAATPSQLRGAQQ